MVQVQVDTVIQHGLTFARETNVLLSHEGPNNEGPEVKSHLLDTVQVDIAYLEFNLYW